MKTNDDKDYSFNESNNCEDFYDSNYYMQNDDALFEENVNHFVEFAEGKQTINFDNNYSYIIVKEKNCHSNCMISADDDSFNANDEDNIARWPTFNPGTALDKINLKLGMLFNSKVFKGV